MYSGYHNAILYPRTAVHSITFGTTPAAWRVCYEADGGATRYRDPSSAAGITLPVSNHSGYYTSTWRRRGIQIGNPWPTRLLGRPIVVVARSFSMILRSVLHFLLLIFLPFFPEPATLFGKRFACSRSNSCLCLLNSSIVALASSIEECWPL